MTCYKVSVESSEAYEQVEQLLKNVVTIFLANKKHLFFTIDEPSGELIAELRQLGATVDVDYHYDFE